MNHLAPAPNRISLPSIPVLHIDGRQAYLLTDEGEIQTLSYDRARMILHKQTVMVVYAPYIRTRLKLDEFFAFDLLELFAFVHPAKFCVPTVKGLCDALFLPKPQSAEDAPLTLIDIAQRLLTDIQRDPFKAKADPLKIASFMGGNTGVSRAGWPWTSFIFSALGQKHEPSAPVQGKDAAAIWKHLPEWAEEAPPPPPSHHGVSADEATDRLKKLRGFDDAEERKSQLEYAINVAQSFDPLEDADQPHIVLAEAGTGVGKTLGYLAPASVWAEKNKGTVWISTYTKNLQRQIDGELERVYPNPEVKNNNVATRKGRENYLCLLNLEETAAGASLARHASAAIGAGIMARWAAATKDGDLTGAEFPGWLSGLLSFQYTSGLADKRGECIYSACDHYRKCFVERSIRKASHARIVVGNHALVMISAAMAAAGDDMPARYIFDEGHHLFDAADSAFSAALSARETRDFRRWIMGHEGGRRSSRARGLKRRAEDLAEGMQDAEEALRKIMLGAECLPLDGWTRRLKDGAPSGPTEKFIAETYRQVFARVEARDRNGPYSLETELFPVNDDLIVAARKLKTELKRLQKPMSELARIFRKKLGEDEGLMEPDTRKRLEAVAASLERRAELMLQSWIDMLENLDKGDSALDKSAFIDWMEIERVEGRAIDVGLHRHHIDPMKPFANSMRPHLQGMTITSATLRDKGSQDTASWEAAQYRAGAKYLNTQSLNVSYASPFDYANHTKIFIINDISRNDMDQLASAYCALFKASDGAGLGLFTAISRLRAVHERIAPHLEESGIPLYSQHMDEIDTGTLVDMFRDDVRSCLLGTDAIRDGVDVPGESLRLIAFDRVPWPRPTILHKARREAFGGRDYDEMITRMKLKQAFGRLIRKESDRGVFVMLDSGLPSRLQNAFPPETEIIKCGLAQTIESVTDFLKAQRV